MIPVGLPEHAADQADQRTRTKTPTPVINTIHYHRVATHHGWVRNQVVPTPPVTFHS
jgi:hypothetical protein